MSRRKVAPPQKHWRILSSLAAFSTLIFIADQAPGTPRTGLRLITPIVCELGSSCFIQSYVDVGPGSEVRDYACGSATYDGHNGIDFRLHSAVQSHLGVAVIAAAAGRVKRVRDSIPDHFARPGDHKGRECGNGVVIAHDDDWETQYCHMRRGSIVVRPGEFVAQGQRLGDVGYSGMAEFAHLHFSVRHKADVIDPFSGRAPDGQCSTDPASAKGLWDARALAAMRYEAGTIIAAGFTEELPGLEALESNHLVRTPRKTSERLILYARLINMRAGDRIQITIKGPSGFEINSTTQPVERNKATYIAYAGRRRTLATWPPGRYEGAVTLLRDADMAPVSRTSVHLTLPD
jgi:hypothetical protein